MPTATTPPQPIDMPVPPLAGEAREEAGHANMTTVDEYQQTLEVKS